MVFKPKRKPSKKKGHKKKVPGVTDVKGGRKHLKAGTIPNIKIPDLSTIQPVTEGRPMARKSKKELAVQGTPPKNLMDIDVSKVQNPWERLPTENDRDYGAFKLFLDLGPNRTIKEVAKRCCPKPDDPEIFQNTLTTMYRVSKDRKWEDRIIAYDRFMQRTEDLEIVRLRKERAKRNYSLLDDAKGLLEDELKAIRAKRAKAAPDQTVMSVTQFTNLMDAVMTQDVNVAELEKGKDAQAGNAGHKVMHQVILVGVDEVKRQLAAEKAAEPKQPDNVVDAEFEVVKDDQVS